MKSIKDIYQWHQNTPKMPSGMTSLQSAEWQEQNSKRIEEINNRSFAGELLTASPAIILDISADKISAYADYKLDYIRLSYQGHEGQHYRTTGADGTPVHVTNITQVSYEILYDKSIFYDTLKLIQPHSMVEVELQHPLQVRCDPYPGFRLCDRNVKINIETDVRWRRCTNVFNDAGPG
jgi:hypothetical protein